MSVIRLRSMIPLLACLSSLLVADLSSAAPAAREGKPPMTITKSAFGQTANGVAVDLYTLSNGRGLVLKMTNFGATVVSLEAPDRNGKSANITLGFPTLAGFLGPHPYFGATVGRFCNRIAAGKFTLDGKQYVLAPNDGGRHHLHGGKIGFNKVVWDAHPIENQDGVGLKFTYLSRDGEEGYPGNLQVTAEYRLSAQNELVIEFSARTDAATPVNLTNHCYWNLAGAGSGTIRNHVLMIAADKYLPVDAVLIPTGQVAEVVGTPLDFTHPETIGARLDQIKADPVGYDHCFVLRGPDGQLRLAARVEDPSSGRVMEIYTTQPALQFYSGNFLDGKPENNGYAQYEGFCLETQHYPDSPNHASFPNTILRPGETFHQQTVHRFYAR